jgi:tetratricopeptide (TPR) repeat protein
MKTQNSPKTDGPNLAKAAWLFGAALTVSLGVGLLLHSDSPEPASARPLQKPAAVRTAAAPSAAHAVAQVATAGPAQPTATSPATAGSPTPSATEAAAGPEIPSRTVTYSEAEEAFHARDPQAAELFRNYTVSRPENAWGHYMLGLALRRDQDLDGAEAAFRAALALDADHLKSRVNLARVCVDAGRPADALPAIERAIELDAESVDARRVYGRVLHSLGRAEEAIAAYDAALTIDPKDAWSLNNRGLIRIEQELFDTAAEDLAAAVEADATVATFHNNLGVALERSGHLAEAELAFAGALDLAPSYEKARISLARVASRVEGLPADPALPLDEVRTPDLELAAGEDPALTDETRP